MKLLRPLIVLALILAIDATGNAQVVEVVPQATYVAPTYVTPAPAYVSPTTAYYSGPTFAGPPYPYMTQPYVTRYGYAPSAAIGPSYPYRPWLASRPIYYGAMRPVVRTYAW